MGRKALTYDVTDAHTRTVLTDGTVIEYERDASGRIVARVSTAPGASAQTVRYTYASDGLFGTLDGSGTLTQQSLSLPGGVSIAIAGGDSEWSYPNLHGDSILLTDGGGSRIGSRASYEPFGQPIDPSTGNIGTTTSDDAVADTLPGSADEAWVGKHRKRYEHQGSIATTRWARVNRCLDSAGS